MKITGIIFLFLAALNFIVALVAASYGALDAFGQKISATALLGVLGGVLYYFGKQKEEEQKNQSLPPVEDSSSTQYKSQPGSNQAASAHSNPSLSPSGSRTMVEKDKDDEELPKPLATPLSANDWARLTTEFQEQMLSIGADGGTKEQTQIKFELLLGKRSKTEAMLAIEKPIRDFFRQYYTEHGEDIISTAGDNPLLRKLAVTSGLLQAHNDITDRVDSPDWKEMIEIANEYGISVHLIDDEEFERAMSTYQNGKIT